MADGFREDSSKLPPLWYICQSDIMATALTGLLQVVSETTSRTGMKCVYPHILNFSCVSFLLRILLLLTATGDGQTHRQVFTPTSTRTRTLTHNQSWYVTMMTTTGLFIAVSGLEELCDESNGIVGSSGEIGVGVLEKLTVPIP